MIRQLLWRPAGVGEWTASSLLSAVVLASLWWLGGSFMLVSLLTNQAQDLKLVGYLLTLAVPVALATHGLLWWQVLRGAWALTRGADRAGAWLTAGAVLWLLALLGFQLLCLLAGCVLLDPTPTSSTPWLQF